MAMFPHHSIVTARIAPPTNPMTNAGDGRFSGTKEPKLYAAYIRNLDSAEALAEKGKFHDAWLLLNLAVECFFKHFYILIRPQFQAHAMPSKKFPLGPLDYDGIFVFFHPRGKDGQDIEMKDFGHEVMVLWQLIWKFTDLHTDTHFLTLKNHIPSQADWVNARYDIPNHLTFEPKYKDYKQSFVDCLNNTFRSFK